MAVIVIRDLPENVELDRQAMAAITGGARSRSGQAFREHPRSQRILGYPAASRPGPGTGLGDWRSRRGK